MVARSLQRAAGGGQQRRPGKRNRRLHTPPGPRARAAPALTSSTNSMTFESQERSRAMSARTVSAWRPAARRHQPAALCSAADVAAAAAAAAAAPSPAEPGQVQASSAGAISAAAAAIERCGGSPEKLSDGGVYRERAAIRWAHSNAGTAYWAADRLPAAFRTPYHSGENCTASLPASGALRLLVRVPEHWHDFFLLPAAWPSERVP